MCLLVSNGQEVHFAYNMGMTESVFAAQVYALARKIPRGKVATYGQLAKLVGHPGAARAVGLLMKHNPYAPKVPCHRVVAADGNLTGFSGGDGIPTKRRMLSEEGVQFKGDKVWMAQSQWQPE